MIGFGRRDPDAGSARLGRARQDPEGAEHVAVCVPAFSLEPATGDGGASGAAAEGRRRPGATAVGEGTAPRREPDRAGNIPRSVRVRGTREGIFDHPG